jgi:hypothetical protein
MTVAEPLFAHVYLFLASPCFFVCKSLFHRITVSSTLRQDFHNGYAPRFQTSHEVSKRRYVSESVWIDAAERIMVAVRLVRRELVCLYHVYWNLHVKGHREAPRSTTADSVFGSHLSAWSL